MIDISFLKTLCILYVEDHFSTQEELGKIFKTFFKKVYIASDGKEGLELYLNNKDEIDVIISDINMPNLSGIGMLKEIRKLKIDVPLIFATAYSESKFLLEAIKLNTSAYILKPYDVENMILKVQSIAKEKENSKLVEFQQIEMQQYIDVIDKVAIISRTNPKGIITFVNDKFCETSGYEEDELLGKAHNIVRHPDMPSEIFKGLWSDIQSGKIWQGKVKNKAKDGESYYVNSTIIPRFNSKKEIIEYIGIRFLITDEENEKRKFKKNILTNIKESRKKESQYLTEIRELEKKVKNLEDGLILKNEVLSNEKQKSAKQHSQLLYYEDEIKSLNTQMENIKVESYKKVLEAVTKMKKFKITNDDLKQKNETLENEVNLRKDEFIKLNEQVSEQAKIIINLKDVIEHRESQLKQYTK
ncbi:response regulator [Malaciobacter marinus]|jgi:PAS domain S-box-containing protein|uniref:response regulator n=1 Tax=Malaciobacter marinus TaxID=505249 RepID=UPI000C087D07|nr:response regulator [Malaciobacter marinus]PHO11924.1 hypothetical protein CPG38_10345 [Malaciobacter marinus]